MENDNNGKVYDAIFTTNRQLNTLPNRRSNYQTPVPRTRSTTLTRPNNNNLRNSIRNNRRPTSITSNSLRTNSSTHSQFDSDQLDLLQVIDPAVQAASTLTHIQNSLLIPPIINRFGTPIIQLQSTLAVHPESPTLSVITSSPCDNQQSDRQSINQSQVDQHQIEEPQINHLDQHLISILSPLDKKSKIHSFFNPAVIRRHIQGIRAFIITPTGLIFTIYGILVVFWGAALTLIILGWIKFDSNHQYRIWVEICSQILNGLFAIPGLGLLPSRLIDWWNISIILHYARVIWKRKGKKNLEDPNDLLPQPDPNHQQESSTKQAEKSQILSDDLQLQGRGENCSSNSRHDQTVDHHQESQNQNETPNPNRSSFEDNWRDDQELVLNDLESTRLRRAQEKLCRSQTWYRPHSSATHYAFPIRWALLIMLLNLGNSIFQIGLCVVMWGLRYSTRPAWTTATFMALSFTCGIASALLIWRIGVKTSKSKKVLKEVKEALKPTTKEKFRNRVIHQHRKNQSKSFQVLNRIKREILKTNTNDNNKNKKERAINDENYVGRNESIQRKSSASIISIESSRSNSCHSLNLNNPTDSSENNQHHSYHSNEPSKLLLDPLSNLSSSHVILDSPVDDPRRPCDPHTLDDIQINHDRPSS